LGAYGDTLAASDAARVDNLDIGRAYPDGLYRAVAYAGIAFAAAFFYSFYRSHEFIAPGFAVGDIEERKRGSARF
jgi:hypothetical protein